MASEGTSGSTSVPTSLLLSIQQRLQQLEDENKDVRAEVAHLRTENEVLRSEMATESTAIRTEISTVVNESTASQVSSWVALQQALQRETVEMPEPRTLIFDSGQNLCGCRRWRSG